MLAGQKFSFRISTWLASSAETIRRGDCVRKYRECNSLHEDTLTLLLSQKFITVCSEQSALIPLTKKTAFFIVTAPFKSEYTVCPAPPFPVLDWVLVGWAAFCSFVCDDDAFFFLCQ